MRQRTTALCAGLTALSLAAPAAADFGRPFTVAGSAEQFPNGFSGVVNPSGTTAFAWTHRKTVRFRIRSAGGDLGDALKVSTSGRVPYVPQVALDRDGNAIVAWHEQTGKSSFAVYAAVRPRGGRFGAPQRVGPSFFSSDFADDNYPLVSFDARGNALIAWRYPQTYVGVAWAAPGRRFGTPQRLLALTPRSITFRHDGRAALLSVRLRGRIVEATARPRGPFTVAGDPFQLPLTDRGIADVDARQAPDSAGLAVWREGYAGDPGVGPDAGPVHAATRRPGGAFGPDQVLSEAQSCGAATTNDALRATGAITTRGEALVTWMQCVGDPQSSSPDHLFARRWSPAGGAWDPVVGLGSREFLGGPATVAADSGGDLAVGWLADARHVAVMGMLPGGEFTPVRRLRTSGDARRTGPRVAADGHRAVVVWGSGDGYQASVGSVAP